MGVLEEVLRYKQQKDLERQADISMLPQAIQSYQAGEQMRQKNLIDSLVAQATLAKQGLIYNQATNTIKKDASVLSEDDTLSNTLKRKQIQAYDQFLGSQGAASGAIPGSNPEDFITKPELRSFKGVPTVVNAQEMKPILPQKSGSQIIDIRSLYQNLENNYNMLDENIKKRMSPLNLSAYRGPLGNLAVKVQSMSGDKGAKEFSTFKAEVDKTFQKYRKDTTGAQAAMKELGWLAPDLPESTDPPDIFVSKTNEALARYAEGEQLLLDSFSQQGYRTGELRKGSLSKNKEVPSKKENKIGKFTVRVK